MPTQTGSIDFTSTGGFKSYATNKYATQSTASDMQTAITQNADAIALRATKTEASLMAQPNLTPYFSADPTDVYNSTTNPHGYWHVALDAASGNWTQLEDGWARLSKDNSSGSSTTYGNVRTEQISTLKPDTDYTLMVEARNVTVSGTVYLKGIALRSGTGQFAATQTDTLTTTSSAVFYQHGKTVANLAGCKESTSGYIQITPGASITGDFRFSLYESAEIDTDGSQTIVPYDGPYKPYIGPLLYASQAELKVQADRIGMVVSNSDASSSLALTADAMEYIGDHVEIKGTDGTSTVISGGKIQANSIGADEINATSLNVSKSLTVGAMTDATASTILNSNVVVGGRNLLRFTTSPTYQGVYTSWTSGSDPTGWYSYRSDSTVETTEGGIKIQASTTANSGFVIPLAKELASDADYTLSFDYRGTIDTTGALYVLCRTTPNVQISSKSLVSTGEWSHFEAVLSWSGLDGKTPYALLVPYRNKASGWFEVRNGSMQLEAGNKATDWTPAPEDQKAYVDAIRIGGRNLLTGSSDISECLTHLNGVTSIAGGYSDPDGGNNAYLITPNATSWYAGPASGRLLLTSLTTPYTFSVWLRADSATQCKLCCRYMDTTPYSSNAARVTFDVTAEWQRYHISAPLKQAQTSDSIWIGQVTTTPIYVYHPMVEMSSRPSDWSPAPEDITAEKYITSIDDNGIRVHAKSNTTTNYATINANGMNVVKGGVSVASYGDTARIGKEASTHVTISASETSGTGYTDSTSDMTLYDATGNSPDLRLYNTSRAWSDDSDGSEEVGIALGRDVYASKIRASIYEGEDPSSNLEILTGDLSTSVNAGTFIGSQRHWASDSSKFDKASVQTTSGAGGGASVQISAMSGNPNAAGAYAGMSVKATSSGTTVTIEADEVKLYDHQQDSYSPAYMTHGVVNSGQSTATPANGYQDFSVTFGHTYTSYPHVVVGFYSTSTASQLGGLSCAVNSITYTGCTIRVFNNTSSARSPAVEWIAIG